MEKVISHSAVTQVNGPGKQNPSSKLSQESGKGAAAQESPLSMGDHPGKGMW